MVAQGNSYVACFGKAATNFPTCWTYNPIRNSDWVESRVIGSDWKDGALVKINVRGKLLVWRIGGQKTLGNQAGELKRLLLAKNAPWIDDINLNSISVQSSSL